MTEKRRGPRKTQPDLALVSRAFLCECEQALRLAPDSATAMIGLANVLLTEVLNLLEDRPGNVSRAAELLAAAERLVPDHRGLPMLRALVLRAQNRLADAVAAYEQVIATNPNSVLAYQQAALCKLLLGQPEDAPVIVAETLVLRLTAHEADIDLLDDDGELERGEDLVPADLGQIEPGACGVALDGLGAAPATSRPPAGRTWTDVIPLKAA